MAKKRNPTTKNVQTWIKKGLGQGAGRDYKPFFKVRDVPSKGRSSKVESIITGRIHNYLSDGEYFHHVLAEFIPNIIDIRDQYALLPWEETQEIASDLGIRYPLYPGTSTPIVMTSDLVLTVQQGEEEKDFVLSVKDYDEIYTEDPELQTKTKRAWELLLIEKTYWARRKIPWKISTIKDISEKRAKNLDHFRTSMVSRELDWLNEYMMDFLGSFNKHWALSSPLTEIYDAVAGDLGIDRYQASILFGRAVWLRMLPVDLDTEIILPDYPLKKAVICVDGIWSCLISE